MAFILSIFLTMKKLNLAILAFYLPVFLFAQSVKIVTNHVGYEFDGPKKAVIVAEDKLDI